ncbi:SRPBCC domain-containing protein [Kibdelosporangium lantanae]
MTEEIHVDQFLAHPPAKVWRTLTEPELLARWFMPNDIKPVVGHRFHLHADPKPGVGFGGGPVPCEVLDVEPERLLRFAWGEHWTVTWRLEPEGRGTRLLLTHAGFGPDEDLIRGIMNGGWRSTVMRRLVDALERSNAG